MNIWIFLVKGIIKLTGLKWVTICHRIINVRNILPKSIAIHIKNYVSGLNNVFILHNIPMENNLAAGITIVISYLQTYKKIYTTVMSWHYGLWYTLTQHHVHTLISLNVDGVSFQNILVFSSFVCIGNSNFSHMHENLLKLVT